MSDAFRDPRAYLQRRVAMFTGVACVFFGTMLVFDYATPAEGESLLSSTRVATMIVIATNLTVWAYARRGVRSLSACRALELLCISTTLGALATLPLFPPIPGAGGVTAMFMPLFMGVVLLLRAAIIPSPWWLSVLLALAWGTVMTCASAWGWEGVEVELPNQPSYDPRLVPISINGFATLAFAFVAGVITFVVHGLQRRVRAAMELGQYTLEAKIGEGGMGAVYRARHRLLRRPTAIKLLPLEKAGVRAVARFEREVQQTSRLTHPNTVAIFDFGRTEDGVFYYAMEHLEGVTLQKLVERCGALPPERVVHLLTQVAGALSEAHGKGLVHRDIKPDNIMLCERGGIADVVKVLDFGLVKDIQAPEDVKVSTLDTIQGTPLYMAPESLTDPEGVDARTDIYSLGAVAYFLLSGTTVFTGKVVEVFGHHLHTAPVPLTERSNVAPALSAIVQRCLAKDPGGRFASASSFAAALAACPVDEWTQAMAVEWWTVHRDLVADTKRATEITGSVTVAPRILESPR